jgi:dehydratase ilvD1
MTTSTKKILRSTRSYGPKDKDGFIHRSWMKSQGFPTDVFDGRPVIGICNTWSELTPCNAGLRDVADYVKRGVWEAGGLPVEFPAMSLGETQMRPTAMLFRNLLAMEVEESIRGNPIDAVVLLGGCDKTTPGQLMGAASVDLPTLVVSTGPMLNGKFRGRDIGSGTDVWKFSESVRAGKMSMDDFMAAEAGMSRTPGTCMTMGSASTMACLMESMGLALPFNATAPAVDAARRRIAQESGRLIVRMALEDVRLSTLITREALENAVRVLAAIGGSTNAVLHLIAVAGRLGVPLTLQDFDQLTADVPLLVDLQPSGKYLMEDLHYAGGLPAVLKELAPRLHTGVTTAWGQPLGESFAAAECFNRNVIHTLAEPANSVSGIWVLHGNLCPDGAVMKPSAASQHLFKHRGRAVVFESIEDLHGRIDDPALEVNADSILVLKGCGPKGYPGMPEVGNMPLPKKILQQGVRDMLRISDARMSGTAFGTVVLHVAPEAAAGGPLSLVQNGDEIEFDGPARRLELLVAPEELTRRKSAWAAAQLPSKYQRGYYRLYIEHVMQADKGCDLDFLAGASGSFVERESH